jgi:uncharacterized protein YraI
MVAFKETMIAAGLLALTASAALAAPAVAERDVNLRSGPGTSYAVVGTLPRGANIEVQDCNGAWCQVNYDGRLGYASQHYLEIANVGPAEPADSGYAYQPPPPYRDYAVAHVAAPAPGYRDYAYAPGYRDYAAEPGYRTYGYYDEPVVAPLPNPLAFPLLPWNW